MAGTAQKLAFLMPELQALPTLTLRKSPLLRSTPADMVQLLCLHGPTGTLSDCLIPLTMKPNPHFDVGGKLR